jgi:hypothetical protein
MHKDLFTPNFQLTPTQRAEIQSSLKKWGWTLGVLTVLVLVLLGVQNTAPEGGFLFDITQKAEFGLMRLVLATVGFLLGVALGYLAYQAIESTSAGSHTTRPERNDLDMERGAKLRNRGFLLAVLTAVGGLVMAIALSGAGGR